MKRLLWAAAIEFLILCWHLTAQGVLPQPPVCTEANHQGKPDVWLDWVVWHDNRTGSYDIYAKDLSSGQEIRISYSGKALNPSIYREFVVWQDARQGDYHIYSYNLETGVEERLPYVAAGNQVDPAIHADTVVWRTGGYPSWPEIWAYSIIKKNAFPIPGAPGNKWKPAVFDNVVVWGDYRNGNWDVYAYDLDTGTEVEIATGPSYQRDATIFAGTIAYENVLSPTKPSSIGIYDLATEDHRYVSVPGGLDWLDMFDNVLVWGDYRSLNGANNSGTDIYGYLIDRAKEFPICTETGWQYCPAVFGNTIVWSDDGEGGFSQRDIHRAAIRKRLYVDASSSGMNNGTSWQNAYKHLQDALQVADSEIFVAAGTYWPDLGANQTPGDREATFRLVGGVNVYGGFPPAGGQWLARDPNTHKTILSSAIVEGDGNAFDPNVLSYEPPPVQCSYHVVTCDATDCTAVLDGFIITRGNADGNSLAGCGGGILITAGSPTLINCVFTNNSAFLGGGAFSYGDSEPNLINCTFIANSAFAGAGFANYYGSPRLVNCTLRNNSASFGGGLCNYRDSDQMLAEHASRLNIPQDANHANTSQVLTNCIFSGNSAQYGGAAYASTGTITYCTITGNKAHIRGGGIHSHDGSISNSIIWNNIAYDRASQLYDVSDITYSCVQGGSPGEGCISSDPCFVVPGYWNNHGTPDTTDDTWVEGDYHLKSQGWRWDQGMKLWTWDIVTSKSIDAGNPGSPLGDEPLTISADPLNQWGQNLRTNMGAYGGTAHASIPPYEWAIRCDLTNDGHVEHRDLLYWVRSWLGNTSHLSGDVNRNGFVDTTDFAVFAEDWLAKTSWSAP